MSLDAQLLALAAEMAQEASEMTVRHDALVVLSADAAALLSSNTLLQSQLTDAQATDSLLAAEVARLRAELDACLNPPPSEPPPPPPPTGWVPPTGPVLAPWASPIPDVTLSPGANVRQAYTNGARKIRLEPGDYGGQILGSMPGATVWCDTYRGAKFDGGFVAGPFISPAAGATFSGLQVERYNPHSTAEGGAMIATDGALGMSFINMAAGKARNNAYSLKGDNALLEGGGVYQCGRYAWVGSGENIVVQDLWAEEINTGVGVPKITSGSRGLCKMTFSKRAVMQRIRGKNINQQGLWFDIQNQPALIEDIYLENTDRGIVFLEVSYGGDQETGDWTRWRVRRINGTKKVGGRNDTETLSWPVPALLQISATPDILAEDIGMGSSGFRVGVSLYNDPNHKQITGELGTTDRSRLGCQNITIVRQDTPDTTYAVAAFAGTAHIQYPEMRQPTGLRWVDPTFRAGDKFRWGSDFIGEAEFLAKTA